jgi:predicted dehydrogenase
MAKIRVGLINCDLHGMYYAALMSKHDPIALRDDKIGRGHAAYYYFYTNYDDPIKMTVPNVGGFQIAKVWDEDPEIAGLMSKIWFDKPEVCKTPEEVSDDVDLVFIADCNGDGSNHLQLAGSGIRKGVPTFIDKPLAYDIKDAESIVKLSKKHNTPILSRSMLSEVPGTLYFKDRLQELGQPEFGIIKGGGTVMAGHIHAISFALGVFGGDVKYVECMGQEECAYIHLDYDDQVDRPRDGVVINCVSGGSPHCAMYASAYSKEGVIHSEPIGDIVFPYGACNILKKIKKMVTGKKLVTSYEEMVEAIAIATAARLAQKQRRRVAVAEILS